MASAAETHSEPQEYSKNDVERRASLVETEKGKWERLWPVIACGAGLFSDGYLNNVRHSNAPTISPTRHASPSPEQPSQHDDQQPLANMKLDYRACQHHAP